MPAPPPSTRLSPRIILLFHTIPLGVAILLLTLTYITHRLLVAPATFTQDLLALLTPEPLVSTLFCLILLLTPPNLILARLAQRQLRQHTPRLHFITTITLTATALVFLYLWLLTLILHPPAPAYLPVPFTTATYLIASAIIWPLATPLKT